MPTFHARRPNRRDGGWDATGPSAQAEALLRASGSYERYVRRIRRRRVGRILLGAAPVLLLLHVLSHKDLLVIYSKSLEDIAIGYPTALALLVIGYALVADR